MRVVHDGVGLWRRPCRCGLCCGEWFVRWLEVVHSRERFAAVFD